MGKQAFKPSNIRCAPDCSDKDAPICGNHCAGSSFPDEKLRQRKISTGEVKNNESITVTKGGKISTVNESRDGSVKELLIIGSGPHALALLLRLLEPDPDFMSEKTRHHQAESTRQMRPYSEVYRHVKDVARGSNAVLKPRKKSKKRSDVPPALLLKTVTESVQVVDANGDWLAGWKQNFEGIGIPQLRSLMNAHSDPYDHRSLECFAEFLKRGEELITLKDLTQRDKIFRGPYQVPSTSIFHDFHDKLVEAYGIKDIVQKGKVLSIIPSKDPENDENIFEVKICNGDKGIATVRSRRCVCALGPNFGRTENSWEKDLRQEQGQNYVNVSRRILRCDEIIQWLQRTDREKQQVMNKTLKRILIVGGGITSVQLVFRAIKASWCESVVFVQRSEKLVRHFDVENVWMGPKRGRVLEEFFSKEMKERAQMLKQARKGGSVPPELSKQLEQMDEKRQNLTCKEEVQISEVEWIDDEFHVAFDDGSATTVDFIWLATGCENTIDKYPVFDSLREALPIDVVNGLPVLSQDLSWSSSESNNECRWKQLARKRIWCMGALAGLQLGADALNIVGARHGAVKIAKAIRCDMDASSC